MNCWFVIFSSLQHLELSMLVISYFLQLQNVHFPLLYSSPILFLRKEMVGLAFHRCANCVSVCGHYTADYASGPSGACLALSNREGQGA